MEIDKRKDEMEEIRQQSILRELALEQSKMEMEKRKMAMELEAETMEMRQVEKINLAEMLRRREMAQQVLAGGTGSIPISMALGGGNNAADLKIMTLQNELDALKRSQKEQDALKRSQKEQEQNALKRIQKEQGKKNG